MLHKIEKANVKENRERNNTGNEVMTDERRGSRLLGLC
jgi:hypothetical protein